MKHNNHSQATFHLCMLANICILLYAATANAQSKSIGTMELFTMEGCFKAHFPLALKISRNSVPPEVRFYCAAPWNFAAFEAIRGHMKSEGLDVPNFLAGSVEPWKRESMRKLVAMNRDMAETGPRGMGAAWHVYHVLPHLSALHAKTPDAEKVVALFQANDVAAMRKVAAKINWKQSALERSVLGAIPYKSVTPVLTIGGVGQVVLDISLKK